ncbi:uncharacterized protein LTR77_010092 [Saxophila tyrrhenica]|uniref:Uncharacterized protein n=1 Tax=Saxophila tyrrhenica TaxID=1690608 RepID=A0AAV9NX60_9PEZI|nr:hypothetical protein LTR77_010092 [Saxophila tyrrhenica]
MLRDETLAKRIKATVLMDPICFMLHLPDVAYNFTRRLPQQANEHMLYYFASQDMMVSHTLARRFFWNRLVLFKDDLPSDMPLTVTLSGQDLIVPTREVWEYLTGEPAPVVKDSEWEEGQMRVHWFEKLDHAGVFANKGIRRGLAKEVRELSGARESNGRI